MKQTVFCLIWLSSGAIAVVNGGRLAYQMFYIMSIIFVLSVIYMLGVFFLIRVDFGVERDFAVSGEKAVVVTRLRSAYFLPAPAVILNFSSHSNIYWPKQAAVSLFPFKTKILRGKATFAYRGTYTIGVNSWSASDYFGVFGIGRRVNKHVKVTVLPRVVPMDDHPPLPPQEIENNARSVSGSELFGARPHVGSDGMRAIHWKLSAKSEEQLFVKEFNAAKRPPVWVVTDLNTVFGGNPEALEDKLLETSLSLTRHLLDVVPVKTAAFTDAAVLRTIKIESDFQDYYQTIGLAEFEGSGFSRLLVETDFGGGGGIIWVVTGNPEITEQLGELLSQGWDICWLFVSEEDAPERFAEANRMGAQTQHISLDGSAADAAWML